MGCLRGLIIHPSVQRPNKWSFSKRSHSGWGRNFYRSRRRHGLAPALSWSRSNWFTLLFPAGGMEPLGGGCGGRLWRARRRAWGGGLRAGRTKLVRGSRQQRRHEIWQPDHRGSTLDAAVATLRLAPRPLAVGSLRIPPHGRQSWCHGLCPWGSTR